jgi:hypothetical protein
MKTLGLLIIVVAAGLFIFRNWNKSPFSPGTSSTPPSHETASKNDSQPVTAARLLEPLCALVFDRPPRPERLDAIEPDIAAAVSFFSKMPDGQPRRAEGIMMAKQLCALMQSILAEKIKVETRAKSIGSPVAQPGHSPKEAESQAKTDAYFAAAAEKQWKEAFAQKKAAAAPLRQRLAAWEAQNGSLLGEADQKSARPLLTQWTSKRDSLRD